MEPHGRFVRILHRGLFGVVFLGITLSLAARPHPAASNAQASSSSTPPKKSSRQSDSVSVIPAKDLSLRIDGEHKADALAHFVEGMSFEENGEIDRALAAYRKVLDVDPGQADLAARVATLLTRQDDFPQAIDVLKDTVKANPKAIEPLLQLAYIYAKYMRRADQAIDYVNKAVAIDPQNIDAYERLCEIALAAGDEKKALQSLDRAAAIQTDNAAFWTRLGKLYAAIVFKPDRPPRPEDIARVNDIFKRAAEHAGDDGKLLKDVAD